MANEDLKYPLEPINSNYDFKGKIKFEIFNEPVLEFQTTSTAIGRNDPGATGPVQNTETFTSLGSDTNLQVSPEKGKCTLYLHQGIIIADNMDYENLNLGIFGGNVEAGLNAGKSALSVGVNGMIDEAKSFAEGITAGVGTQAARIALARAAARGSDAFRGAVGSATRTAINPHSRTLFRAVNLREFTFNYKLIADSQREAEEIKAIIKWFRTNMYPYEEDTGGLTLAYRYPDRFKITMYYEVDSKQYATKILPAYLRNFQAAYNTTSMGIHKDGSPVEVDITMNFSESRALTRREIDQEGY